MTCPIFLFGVVNVAMACYRWRRYGEIEAALDEICVGFDGRHTSRQGFEEAIDGQFSDVATRIKDAMDHGFEQRRQRLRDEYVD